MNPDITKIDSNIENAPQSFQNLLQQIPLQTKAPFPDWVRSELFERFLLLQHTPIRPGMKILEIGCGAHALSSNVLGYYVGPTGTVVAVDRERWHSFERMVNYTDYHDRILPLKIDAPSLPIPYRTFDLGVILHGIRSMGDDANLITILQELLRVSHQIIIAESLPIAHTTAQKAHLDMYNLREIAFEAINGRKDDTHYRPVDQLVGLVKSAGATQLDIRVIEFDLPHFLAVFPKEFLNEIPDPRLRSSLFAKWEKANRQIQKVGEKHPPVCIIQAAL